MQFVWGFRVASRPEVGKGHIQRARALAEAFRERVAYFFDPQGDAPDAALVGSGAMIEAEPAPGRCDRLLGALAQGRIQGAVFDGYDFSEGAIEACMARGPCVRIDDFGTVRRASLVVNPTIGVDDGIYGCVGVRALCGAEYALLHSDYATENARVRSGSRSDRSRRLLVSFGARDSRNHSAAVLDAVRQLDTKVEITVVLGAHAPHRREIEAACSALSEARLVVEPPDMIALYREADLAVGAGGVSLLERMCCGLPSLVVALEANQRGNIEGAVKLGAAVMIEESTARAPQRLAAVISASLADHRAHARIRAAGLTIVDGQGANRVAAAMRAMAV